MGLVGLVELVELVRLRELTVLTELTELAGLRELAKITERVMAVPRGSAGSDSVGKRGRKRSKNEFSIYLCVCVFFFSLLANKEGGIPPSLRSFLSFVAD